MTMQDPAPQSVACRFERHAPAMLEIFNHAILHSTALYDYDPRTLAHMQRWFEAKAAGPWPVIGLEDAQGRLLGFASYGPFRAFPAYKYTAEHSIYVHPDHRGAGLGERLLRELIAAAHAGDLHVLVGAIDASNEASLALHRRLGFVDAGTLRQVGYKFGRWLDLSFMQLTLATPAAPRDGLP
jgi:L-amino acid N-acyltransferase